MKSVIIAPVIQYPKSFSSLIEIIVELLFDKNGLLNNTEIINPIFSRSLYVLVYSCNPMYPKQSNILAALNICNGVI